MSSYIDIHSHILPQIDDGAKNIDMSIKMLRIAQQNGIYSIILTPHNKPMHHNASPEKIRSLTDEVQEAANKKEIAIRLYVGNEIYYRSNILEILEERKASTLADSMYVLVEFGPMDDFDYIRNGIYQLLSGGFRPILAHVERYGSVASSVERVRELVKMGCYIQINAGSVMGQYGFGTKKFTRQILKQGLVHFVATDAHDDVRRRPCLLDCAKYIDKKFGEDYAEKILKENPEKVINNEYI